MPAKRLIVERKADKQFLKFPIQIQQRIIHAYTLIQQNPISGGKLHGELSGYYKYRIGDYRILYRFSSKISIVTVVKIEHRQGVYK